MPDAGIDATVFKIAIPGLEFESIDAGAVRMVLGAGVPWDDAVTAASERALWGIENLAGIPGTAGGAAVQNIGAYGAELAEAFEYADVFDIATGGLRRIERGAAGFAYRESIFKHERHLVVTKVALVLRSLGGVGNLAYKDLQKALAAGTPLATPGEIAQAVRAIRAGKFPDLSKEGTAGSFFKNPLVSREFADALSHTYPELPSFPAPSEASAKEGQADRRVKLSLAWLLDHALGLKGLSVGKARLYEHQPLVIATSRARAHSRRERIREDRNKNRA